MSICGAHTEVEIDDFPATVYCSLPLGHAESHAGRVWWDDDASLLEPESEEQA